MNFTSDNPWDPSTHDCAGTSPPQNGTPMSYTEDVPEDSSDENTSLTAYTNEVVLYKPKSILPYKPDLNKLRPHFGWIGTSRIKHTLRNTTQWYQADQRVPMRRHYRSRFPGANVPRREETVATDTIFSDTPALDDGIMGHGGCTMLQFYCGCTSEFCVGFPMSNETQVYKTLSDFIRFYGAPKCLFSDNAKSEICTNVQDILRHYTIGHYHSEPYQQNQKPAECRIQDIKRHTNVLMDRTGTPPELCLLCMLYVIDVHNHIASSNNPNHCTPI